MSRDDEIKKLKKMSSPCAGCKAYCGACDLDEGRLGASVMCLNQGGKFINIPRNSCAMFEPVAKAA